ncbi:MAG TPA: hypothetical protein ENJ44_07570, partial [Oceanospirillales bacterium]|nr:hypothetical protein [Oceanospirillales bacterium]
MSFITLESGGPVVYSYDKLGNRTATTTGRQPAIPYTIDANSNRLLKVGSQTINRQYDNNGNTLSLNSAIQKFSYNKANRMSQMYTKKDANSTYYTLKAEYFYNGIGQRIYKKYFNNANKPVYFNFMYNTNGQLLYQGKQKGNNLSQKWKRETIWLGNKPIAQVRTIYGGNPSTEIYYILSDHLNTPRMVTNTSGTVLWSWNSDAFGTTAANEDVDANGQHFTFNLRFPGQFFDSESGKHYNYFRDYEAQTGRYLQSDPIGLYGNWNTYEYVNSQPLRRIDVSGLICDNCTSTGLPPKFQSMMRERLLAQCRKTNSCCQKSYSNCVVDCVSTLNPWWTVPVGGGLAGGALTEGACGTASTYTGVALGGWAV